jgi:hypothetical protein
MIEKMQESEYNAILSASITEDMELYQEKSRQGLFLSSHKLLDFSKNPKLYQMTMDGLIKKKNSTSFKKGSAVHTLTLEGKEVFDKKYYVGELINPTTGKSFGSETKKFQEWRESIGIEKEVMNKDEENEIIAMRNAVFEHDEARKLINYGCGERVIRGEIEGVDCQIRPDWIGPYGCFDLKTCDDLDWFSYDFKKLGYDFSSGFYTELILSVTNLDIDYYFVVVETMETHRVGVFKVGWDIKRELQAQVKKQVRRLKEMKTSNKYLTGYEDVRVLL